MSDRSAHFEHRFGRRPEAGWFSPGRVNLIGEHTDYNDGWVLPMAIQLGNRFDLARNDRPQLRLATSLFDELLAIPLGEPEALQPRGGWQDYVIGCVKFLLGRAQHPCGLDLQVTSTLPPGCGLSSSASMTTGLITLLDAAWQTGLTPLERVRLAQAVENDFVGLECGILDPFAVAMGEDGQVLALDCGHMAYRAVPFPADDHAVLAIESGVPRKLSESPYNQRRAECRRALALARRTLDIASLSELSIAQLEGLDALAEDPVARRRARHVVSENDRVREAAAALEHRDLTRFGELLVASHRSLASDYQASCEALDVLVDLAIDLPGVIGAKMTGAGFGGSVVAVVATDAVDGFQARLTPAYRRRMGLDARCHVCRPSAGVHELAMS